MFLLLIDLCKVECGVGVELLLGDGEAPAVVGRGLNGEGVGSVDVAGGRIARNVFTLLEGEIPALEVGPVVSLAP